MEVDLGQGYPSWDNLAYKQLRPWMVSGQQKLVCIEAQFEEQLMLPLQENCVPGKDQQLLSICLIDTASKPDAKMSIFHIVKTRFEFLNEK